MRYVRTERRGEVAVLTLSNPDGGFMTGDMVREIEATIAASESEGEVRCVVFTGGVEGTFVTHYSLDDAEQLGDMPPWFRRRLLRPAASALLAFHTALGALPRVRDAFDAVARRTDLKGLTEVNRIHDLLARMESMNIVFIAAINGNAMGGGCELALACDFRLMARGDYAFGLPEAIAGVFPGAGGTQRMARMIGPHRALELILDGIMLDADAAERIGLVTRAVPAAALMGEALSLAERLARRPPLSVGAVKRAIHRGLDLPMADAIELEKASFVETGLSDDAVVAGRHYFDKYRGGTSPRAIFDGYRDGTAVSFQGR